jgi:hypothetical protein
MKSIALSPQRALSALFAFFLLCGCFAEKNTRVAGGDDVPNDVEPLGKHAAAARDDSADWNGFKSAPRTAPGMYDTTSVPDSMPDTAGAGQPQPKRSAGPAAENAPKALAKGSAAGGTHGYGSALPIDSLPIGGPLDTVTIHIVDSAQGALEAVHAQVKDGARTVDSTVFVPVDPAHPGSSAGVVRVSGRISYADTGLWKTYLFRDADGDGFLTPRPGSANLADLNLAAKAADGKVTRLSQRIAAGPDLDFNRRGDNRLLASLMAVTSGTDTLRSVRLLDADGDSAVIDFSKDTNLVDLIETDRNPGDTGASVTVAERLVVYSRDSTRNYAVRYRRSEIRPDVSLLVLEGRGPGPDSAFRAGDLAAWMVTRTFPQGNSASLATRAFTIRLGAKPGDFGADSLVRLETTEHYRDQAYEVFSFSLRPDAPVADGRWPAGGEVDASLLYRDGAVTGFTGAADATGMHGSLKDVSGSVLSISFDRQGRPATAR